MDFFYEYDIEQKTGSAPVVPEVAETAADVLARKSLLLSEKSKDLETMDLKKANVISDKLDKILNSHDISTSWDTNHLVKALREVPLEDGVMCSETGVVGIISRRNLKTRVKNDQLLSYKKQLLQQYKPVYESVVRLQQEVDSLNAMNKEFSVKKKAGKNKLLNQDELKQLTQIQAEKNKVLLKKSILASYKKEFELNEYERYLLSNLVTVETFQDFCSAFKRAKQIYENCSILLSMQNSTIGSKLIQDLSTLIDKALANLVYFVEALIKKPDQQNFHILRDCIEILVGENKESVVKEVVLSNQSKLVLRDFEQVNQIESFDHIRYFNDVLTTTHSIIINESENLQLLFPDTGHEAFVKELLCAVIDNLARPLRLKLEHVINLQNSIENVSQFYSVLKLYELMFSKVLGSECLVIKLMQSLQNLLRDKVFTITNGELQEIDKRFKTVQTDGDLQTPEWLIDYFDGIHGILKKLTNDSHGFMDFTEETYDKFTSLLISRPLEIIEKSVQNKHPVLEQILNVNSVDFVLGKITSVSGLSKQYDVLNDKLMNSAVKLAGHFYDHLLEQVGLKDIVEAEMVKEDVAAQMKTWQFVNINAKINDVIPNVLNDEILFQISSQSIYNQVIEQSALKFLNVYKSLHDYLFITYNNQTETKENILTWSDLEIATLLGVEKAYVGVQDEPGA